MIDPVSFLLLIVLATGLSQAVLPSDPRARLFWIAAPGLLLLFITHPLALYFAFASFGVSTGVFLIARRLGNSRAKALAPYSILLLLFVPDVARLLNETPILWLGSAFFIIRQMMTVAHSVKQDVPVAQFFPALAIATFFFAALPSGPVFNGLKSWEQLAAQAPPAYGEGSYRLFEGFVYLFAVSGFLSLGLGAVRSLEDSFIALAGVAGFMSLKLVIEPVAAFAFLFATFYGYSRMAEGSALLLGFEVPQNFNKPHLARDLGDFWKRWHRSMAEFVMQYIYLPLLVTTSRTRFALIAAFVFMGLWHDLSAGFLIWGVGHGVGLAYILPMAQRSRLGPIALRIGSLAYVILLSAIAHGVWRQ